MREEAQPKPLNVHGWVFFHRNFKWAGRSARYDRRVRNAEAAGSHPARSTFSPSQIITSVIYYETEVTCLLAM